MANTPPARMYSRTIYGKLWNGVGQRNQRVDHISKIFSDTWKVSPRHRSHRRRCPLLKSVEQWEIPSVRFNASAESGASSSLYCAHTETVLPIGWDSYCPGSWSYVDLCAPKICSICGLGGHDGRLLRPVCPARI